MAEPNSNHEKNAEPQNPVCGDGRPQEPPQGGRLPDVSDTVKDVRALWEKAVSPDASPGSSIKAGGIGAGLEAASKLLPRLRRLSKVKEEKEKPEESDFELIELLGKGGMGMVFLARQKSLDREVAVKVIQPKAAEDAEARGKFFAEALVTGELDHPNIVPVYDFGGTPEGVLFYPMKQVRGTSWNKVIKGKSLDDNLSVLLSVSDAVAFAHDKGVIHRDLKPENVMLGDYGEVYVMDWGLAASVGMEKAEKLTPETGFAGTPAYMAPEMAKCEPTRIGPASDIYLLGAILYEIVTGLRPHTGDDVYSCIHAAMENVIQPTEKKGELVEIALKAMATEPQERHKSVKDFQRVVREYRSHAESLKLSAAAEDRLSAVKEKPKTEVYRECTETIAGYQQAIELWSRNEAAILGLRKARETFVEVALERGDLALAQSQVAAIEEECGKFVLPEKRLESPKDLAEKVSLAIAQAARKERIARLSRRAAIAAASLVLIVSVTAYFITRAARDRAEQAFRKAELENYYHLIALADGRVADARIDQAETLLWSTPSRLRGWEWGRLMRACHNRLLTFGGEALALSPDGKLVAAAVRYSMSTDTGMREITNAIILDAESGRALLTLSGHSGPVTSIAFSADGSRVVTGSDDSTAKIWDAESGQEILTLKGQSGWVKSVAFSLDGKRVVTGSGQATIWHAESGQEILTLEGQSAYVHSVAFSPDGKRVVTAGGEDKTAKIWDAESGQELLTLTGHSKSVACVAFSPDGRRVATASSDGTAKVWDAQTGQEVLTLRGHSGKVFWIGYSLDGRRVVTGGEDYTARIWDAATGGQIWTLPDRWYVNWAAFFPDGKRVVTSAGRVIGVSVWDPESGLDVLVLGGDSGQARVCASFSPDSKRVVTASEDETAKIWDAESGHEILTLKGHSVYVVSVAFSPDGKRVVTASWDKTAKIWDAESGQEILTLKGHSEGLTSVALSPDGKRVVTGSADATAKIWDGESGQEILTLKGHSEGVLEGALSVGVLSVAFSPDGKRVVTRGADFTAKLWDAESGQEIQTLKGHSDYVRSVAFSPDGRTRVVTLKGHKGWVKSVAFSPDGKRVVTGTSDGTAIIWDAESGQEILTLKRHHSLSVTSAAFSPNGKRLVTGSDDGTAKVWNPQTGKEILTLKGHSLVVTSVAFSPNGKRLVTAGGGDHTAKIWDSETGYEILSLRHQEGVNLAAFSPDGKRVVTVGDETVRIWDAVDWHITPQRLEKEQRERYKRWLERNREAPEVSPPRPPGDELVLTLPGAGEVKLTMRRIPAGTFIMGSPMQEGRPLNEGPAHEVTLSKPFYMGVYEVTQEQWEAVMGTNPSHFGGKPTHPVEKVSWDDIQAFLQKLNAMGLGTFRLPTEAEWEYACRADTRTPFYWGDDLDGRDIADYAWYGGNSGGSTHPVGQKKPNTWGLYDMSGNVVEWCQDWYADKYPLERQTDPTGPVGGFNRVIRGGWFNYARYCRSGNRNCNWPSNRDLFLGFRLVRTIE